MPIDIIDTLARKNGANFPLVKAEDSLGAFVTVADTTARDAIPTGCLRIGQVVRIGTSDSYFEWTGSAWSSVAFGGSGGGGTSVLDPIRIAAVTNITLSGTYTHQGVALQVGDSVGAFGQTTGSQGGVYVVAAEAWARRSDMDTSVECIAGMGGIILEGTYANGSWALLTDGATLGTTALDFRVEPFRDTTGGVDADLVYGGATSTGLLEATKVQNRHIVDNTLALSKIATGGAGDAGKVPVVNGSGVLALATAPNAAIQAKNESGTNVGSPRSNIKASWWNVLDDGASVVLQPHAKIAKARVRLILDTNMSTTTISTSQQSVTLSVGDVVYYGAQSTPAQNGLYRVTTSGGAVAKMPELDAVISSIGLYVKAFEGTYADEIRKFTGTGTLAGSVLMPAVSESIISFATVIADDFVIPGDNISRTAGNWAPIEKRARAAAYYGSAPIEFRGAITFRFTSRVDCWSLSEIRADHVAYGLGGTTGVGPRFLFDGCAGFYGVGLGGYTYDSIAWDAGIRGGAHLRGLNCVQVNGTTDAHYGVLATGSTHIERCVFANFYGRGIDVDSTIGAVGSNANGATIEHTTVQASGLSAFHFKGGDANNFELSASRSSNHGQRDKTAAEYDPIVGTSGIFPGDDWGLLDEAFLGVTVMSTELSSGHIGGVYALLNKSRYLGLYTEGGTTSDIRGANVFAGNMALRGVYLGLGSVSVTFANSGGADTITRASGSWPAGLLVGDRLTITGTTSNNITTGPIASLTSTTLTFDSTTSLVNEGPVTATLVGTNPFSRVSAGNPTPTTRLPRLEVLSTNQWAMSGLVCTDDNDAAAGRVSISASGSMIDRGPIGSAAATSWHTQIGTGGNTNTIATGYGTASAAAETLETLPGFGAGAGLRISRKGVVKGDPAVGLQRDSFLPQSVAAPSTGVPDTGSPGSALSGDWAPGSILWDLPEKPRIGRVVITNSGTPSYNLTWGAIANPSAPAATLLSTTTSVALYAAAANRVVGGRFVMAATTTSGAQTITISPTDALKGDRVRFLIRSQGHNVTLSNGGAGTTTAQPDVVLASGAVHRAEFVFDGTDWIEA